jgi:hypothetical protein
MDNLQQILLEQINLNLQNLSLYIEKLTREEIKIDATKIYLIDYSNHEWLHISEYQSMRETLEKQNQEAVNAIIKEDFGEYCRRICIQIETLLNKFINGNENLQDTESSKFKRLKCFFESVRKDFKSYEDKEYKIITNIMNIRDIASHGDYNGIFILENMIELKGKFIEIKLEKLDNKINKANLEQRILKLFSEFVMDEKKLQVKLHHPQEGKLYAYVKMMYNIKNTYLDYQLIKNYLDANYHKVFKLQLGNDFTYSKSKESNELKAFFEQQDYAQIKHTMNWFIQEIGKHLK